ncbi:MFS transporter [Mesorhizobium sp. ESP7-2]|uniref:MFS transporter n=1 Tax=Mesorhizobium sp. ESP7-2 TaxID=2876622 RepID=UPI001CCD89AF|nr:MFS transporter [Mesorhizobium sp. ESP7-2]MBZ9708615.1 MFS transporter [Mesorhizobium sp. ESP7-2]
MTTLASAGTSGPRAMALAGELHSLGVHILLAGAFLPIADFFIVNVALPTIQASLNATPAALELVVSVYGVAYAATLVLGGRLGDRFGRHRLFLIGLCGFILASLACGLAPTIGSLIGARLIQGMTAAMLVPQVLATFQATLPGERKTRAIALYGATSGIAAIVGQLAGGLLVNANLLGTSWRPIFLINIPLGILVFIASRLVVPANRSPHPAGIDLPGTVLFAATLTALLVPLTEGHSLGWPMWTWAMLAAAVALAVLTVIVERAAEVRGELPLLPPSLLTLPSMSRGLAMVTIFSLGFGAFMFVFALTVQNGLGATAFQSSLAILPMAIMFFIGSMASPRIIHRFGRAALAAGGILQALGLLLLIGIVVAAWPHVSLVELALPLMLIGAGQSMLFSGLFRAVLADVPAHLAGVGSGVLITLQQSGLALGVAILGTLYLILEPAGVSRAFGIVIGVQFGIIVLLVFGSSLLPRFTKQHGDVVPVEM